MNIFINKNRQLRNIWWVAIFFVVLASLTIPFILLSKHYKWEITAAHQALIVIGASWICQFMRRKPFTELTGKINSASMAYFLRGSLMGAALMLAPALFLYAGGWASWQVQSVDAQSLCSVTGLVVCVAVTEEFLFRGFLFQRLMASIGSWGAQLIIGGYFLLTHSNNPGMAGNVKVFASLNIFLASIMFGLAFIRTNSLSMPVALHFMANWVQGTLLGFGVSGNEQTSFLKPIFNEAPQWLIGSSFGLEASVPGLICVVISIVFLYRWKPAGKENNCI